MDDNEFFQLFVAEARELIDKVEPSLIVLSQSQSEEAVVDKDMINSVFRLFHSMKGSAGCLGLQYVASVTHEAETLLDIFRSTSSSTFHKHIDLLLRAIDIIRSLLDLVEKTTSDVGMENECKAIQEKLVAAIRFEKGEVEDLEPVLSKGCDTCAAPKEACHCLAVENVAVPALEVAAPTQQAAPETTTQEATPPAKESWRKTVAAEITDEMISRFISEGSELLESIEQDLLKLDKNPEQSKELVPAIMRAMHSFKGNSGFLGYLILEEISHDAEVILQKMRDGSIPVTNKNSTTILHVLDILREGLILIQAREPLILKEANKVLQKLQAIVDENSKAVPEATAINNNQPSAAQTTVVKAESMTVQPSVEKTLKPETAASTKPVANSASPKNISKGDIRVDLGKLDTLINLVGELITAESMVTRNSDLKGLQLENFDRAAHHLRRVAADLQDMSMNIRMIPVSATFQKMIRIVHDVSAKIGKKVKLELVGEDTEVDKTVIESISDPLVHMVRNSMDHGIELPTDRIAAGKEETGTVRLEAKHQGGEVLIILTDDGRGINHKRVLQKAIESGLVKGDGSHLTEDEINPLIFEPGLSTAEKLTEVSGRGVGMDVVKKNIDKLNGKVKVKTTKGKGTTVTLHIPLTLAIIEGMLVRVGESRYTIPILSIRESLCPDEESITRTPSGQEVVRVRNELIPVIRIHEVYNQPSQYTELHQGILVIVEDQGKTAALFVDELEGQQQTVVKALSKYFGSVEGVTGCTILGDGRISLILDVKGIIEQSEEATNIINQ